MKAQVLAVHGKKILEMDSYFLRIFTAEAYFKSMKYGNAIKTKNKPVPTLLSTLYLSNEIKKYMKIS
jgi:hypothetical protein